MRVLEPRSLPPTGSTSSAAKRFADALLGRTPRFDQPPDDGAATRPTGSERLRLIEHYRWLMAILPSRADVFQRQLDQRLAEQDASSRELSAFARRLLEDEWDASKHPRRGGPPNAGWFADKGTGTTATGSIAPDTTGQQLRVAPVSWSGTRRPLNKDILVDLGKRRRQVDALTGGGPTRQSMRSQRVAGKIASAGKLPKAITDGLASGAKTGGKALINGGATAVKNVATLGLSTSQLELIGVTDEDRANGYDTAVSIATASGEVLIAVGTGGIGAALKNGGAVARAANGALIVHDAAGNAVGVVQGIYDAKTNGVTVSGGASIAANALGLRSALPAAPVAKKANPAPQPMPAAPPKSVGHQPSTPPPKFKVGRHKDMPSPRPGEHSHHGVMSAWMSRKYPGYDKNSAPAVLMPTSSHRKAFGIYRKWRVAMTRQLGGVFDWSRISEEEMRRLGEQMFDAASVPAAVRQKYWEEFGKMKKAL